MDLINKDDRKYQILVVIIEICQFYFHLNVKVYGIEIEKIHHKIALDRSKNINNIELFNYDATKFDYDKIDKISIVTQVRLEHIDKRVLLLNQL